jgi:hypothetical protein
MTAVGRSSTANPATPAAWNPPSTSSAGRDNRAPLTADTRFSSAALMPRSRLGNLTRAGRSQMANASVIEVEQMLGGAIHRILKSTMMQCTPDY